MSKTKEDSAFAFRQQWQQMEVLSAKNNDTTVVEADRIANQLLSNPKSPLMYRIRAHMCLGFGDKNYLYHAARAVFLVHAASEVIYVDPTDEQIKSEILAEMGFGMFRGHRTVDQLEAEDNLLAGARAGMHLAWIDNKKMRKAIIRRADKKAGKKGGKKGDEND